ncbi:hypothetical protein GQX74_013662 [Glossina fuscipes]|nr:hypothetical protein GQX74_013662 [Glossina fuscipes]
MEKVVEKKSIPNEGGGTGSACLMTFACSDGGLSKADCCCNCVLLFVIFLFIPFSIGTINVFLLVLLQMNFPRSCSFHLQIMPLSRGSVKSNAKEVNVMEEKSINWHSIVRAVHNNVVDISALISWDKIHIKGFLDLTARRAYDSEITTRSNDETSANDDDNNELAMEELEELALPCKSRNAFAVSENKN